MIRPTDVKARVGRRIWLRYSDGAAGEIDLSHLAGRGVFTIWDAPGSFETVYITSAGGIAWGEDVELCPDALYMQLTGKSVEEVMPRLRLAPRRHAHTSAVIPHSLRHSREGGNP